MDGAVVAAAPDQCASSVCRVSACETTPRRHGSATAMSAPSEEQADYESWQARHPNVLERWAEFEAALEGKRVAVFSDYDGTLTPIVDQPECAFMGDEMRAAVKAVASHFPAAIISGRCLSKVTAFVQLEELFYAGSHGFDIVGPRSGGAAVLVHQPVPWAASLMDSVHDVLVSAVAHIEGASVEHNKFCVSVHYRMCPDRWPEAALMEVVGSQSRLHVTRGRKVFEVRPNVEWDKGKALLFLLGQLGMAPEQGDCARGGQPGVCSVYLGDDVSDEDAFRTLAERTLGLGILVASRSKPTAARYTLRSPEEVQQFMWRLVEVGLRRQADLAARPPQPAAAGDS